MLFFRLSYFDQTLDDFLTCVSISFPVIEIHGNAKSRGAGGPAEKDLGLPARSRFGEGRAAPLKN
jgi:hypothetical protein